MRNVSRSPFYSPLTFTCMYNSVWVDVFLVQLVCQGGIKKKILSRNSRYTHAFCPCFTYTHTHIHTPVCWLSVLQEFFLHLNQPQKVSYGSYHMLILCERAPINILVCITPRYTCMCMCVCACLRKDRQAHGTAHAGCFGSVRETITVASKVRWSDQGAQMHLCVWIEDVGSSTCAYFVPRSVSGIIIPLSSAIISEE